MGEKVVGDGRANRKKKRKKKTAQTSCATLLLTDPRTDTYTLFPCLPPLPQHGADLSLSSFFFFWFLFPPSDLPKGKLPYPSFISLAQQHGDIAASAA